MASPAWQQLPNAGQPQQGHWAQPPGTANQVQGQSQGHGRGIYPGYPASPSQPYHRGNQLNSSPGGTFISSSPNVSMHQTSSISVQFSQATSPSPQSAQPSGSSPQTGSNISVTPGQPMQATGSSMPHLPNILGQPGYPLRWQSPQLGFTARPDAPLLGTRPGLPTSSIAGQSMGAAPTLVQHPYQPYQPSGAPPSQWMHPTQCQSPQRPQFLYASNFSLPYQRQDGMHGTAQPSFRPLGDPFPGGHHVGIWGSQVDHNAGGAAPKELPDFHASKMSTAVTSEEKSHIVSDSKSEKNFKFEVSEEDSWAAHKTEDGVIYYYNSVTGESTYEKPINFKGEAGSVTSQLTPVSWEKLTGTEWLLVTTNDGKKYYYNPRSQATSWQVPVEIVERAKKQADEPVSASPTISTPAALSGGREAKGTASNAPTALDTIKKKLQESSGGGIGSTVLNSPISDPDPAKTMTSGDAAKDKSRETDMSTSDSSSDSEEEGPTKEDRILQFKEMLKEKGVAPFSKWEKELPKIIFDPRFKAIPSHDERRSTFEHYVRTRAEEERKEKRAAQKAAIEGFKQLLEEATKDISHNTTYESIARVWGRDPRFEALDRKDREVLLNERVLPLRKAEEERYKSIHAAAAAEFQAMLKERGDINTTSRWSKVKDLLRNDSRYKGVKREDREGIFNAYVAELRAAEQEAEKAAKAKREEENKLREREREMRKRKEREEQELERVRAKARRKDAVTAYQALLTEKVKDPEASWTESRPKLEKDPLGRATNPELDLADRERLFRDHVKELYERCEKEYRALLADVLTPDAASRHLEDGKDILTSWSDAKELLKSEHRYNRMPRRARETWWQRYAEDVQRRLKANARDEKHDSKDLKAPTSSKRLI